MADSPDFMQMIAQLLRQGSSSNLFQSILDPLLQVQQRGFGDQQRNLTDMFRSAGALKGGSYGIAAPRLLGDQGLASSSLIGQTTSSMLGPLLSAMMTGRGQDLGLQAILARINAGQQGGGYASSGGSNDFSKTFGTANDPYWQSLIKGQDQASNQPIDIDKLLETLIGGGSGNVPAAGLGSQQGWSNPQDYLDYGAWQ